MLEQAHNYARPGWISLHSEVVKLNYDIVSPSCILQIYTPGYSNCCLVKSLNYTIASGNDRGVQCINLS